MSKQLRRMFDLHSTPIPAICHRWRQSSDGFDLRQATGAVEPRGAIALSSGMVPPRPPSGFIPPCQPSKAARPPSGPDWVHEIKHDGYRLMVRRDGPRVRCFTKNGHDWADRFPAIVDAALRIDATSFLIDGEAVVVSDDGRPDFHALRTRRNGHAVVLYAFDLIEHDGDDLCSLSLLQRPTARQVPAAGHSVR